MGTKPHSSHTSFVKLRAVKVAHTLVWAFFAGCILGIPIAAAVRSIETAACLIAIVGAEVIILLFNSWRCPLTAVAAQYTVDREPNFDIYLPVWLAKHNKIIFGSMYVAGIFITCLQWARAAI